MSGQGGPPRHGLAMRFHVRIDGMNLGSWSKVSGLEVKADVQRLRDHGNYAFKHISFADVDYPTVKLERAMDKTSSAALRQWLSDKLDPWGQPGVNWLTTGDSTATITLLDPTWTEVCSWTLRNVYPSKWSAPTLSASTSAVAVEQLNLEHEGFL